MEKIKIIYNANHPQLQDSPAGCIVADRVIIINPKLYNKLTPFQKKFTILHEVGHIELNTSSEIACDAYAFDHLAGTEFESLRNSVDWLNEIMDSSNPTLAPRYEALYQRALEWDAANPEIEKAVSTCSPNLLDWVGITNHCATMQKQSNDHEENMAQINADTEVETLALKTDITSYTPLILGAIIIIVLGYSIIQ